VALKFSTEILKSVCDSAALLIKAPWRSASAIHGRRNAATQTYPDGQHIVGRSPGKQWEKGFPTFCIIVGQFAFIAQNPPLN
jgi:hypothetical protein